MAEPDPKEPCPVGKLGCACLVDGACNNGLDCVAGTCARPELVSDAANGWSPVTCWAPPELPNKPFGEPSCYAARGDVVHRVFPACHVADMLSSGEWTPTPKWKLGFHYKCAEGLTPPAPTAPWDDSSCFASADGEERCLGRIGHLWTDIYAECMTAPHDDGNPWPETRNWGCLEHPQSPTNDQAEEWRCGAQDPALGICFARYGSHWTRAFPECYVTGERDFTEVSDEWPHGTCD